MNERVTYSLESYEPDKDAALAGLEMVDDLLDAQARLTESLGEFAEAEVISIKTGERLTFQEKYQTAYNPESTIPELGRRGMAVVLQFPQIEQTLADNTVRVMDKGADVVSMSQYKAEKETRPEQKTIYRDNGLAYAQDQPETMGYTASATAIIEALLRGDQTMLGALPPRFQKALSDRMASYEGEVPTDEYEAMISVACNGLAEANGRLELQQAA